MSIYSIGRNKINNDLSEEEISLLKRVRDNVSVIKNKKGMHEIVKGMVKVCPNCGVLWNNKHCEHEKEQ